MCIKVNALSHLMENVEKIFGEYDLTILFISY